MKRHTLIKVSHEGREQAFKWILEEAIEIKQIHQVKELVVEGIRGIEIPGIIRRRDELWRTGTVAAGFSSPYRINGNRIRVPSFIPEKEIIGILTPYEIINHSFIQRTNALSALAEIHNAAKNFDIELGVWGSASLEICTALPYTHDKSDLDLIMKPASIEQLEEFYTEMKRIGTSFNCNVDVELEFDSFDIKVAELLDHSVHILGKGLDDVQLLPRETILKWISEAS